MYICLGANTMGYSFRSAFLSVLPGEARGMSVCSVTVNCRKAWIKPSAINRITYTKMLCFFLYVSALVQIVYACINQEKVPLEASVCFELIRLFFPSINY